MDPVEGAEVVTPKADAADGGKPDDVTPPVNSGDWWKFADKDAAVKWSNELVEKRLARKHKTDVEPVAAERDTLKSEVERLKPFEAATQSDQEKKDARIAELEAKVGPLEEFKSSTVRTNLIRSIAEEIGLPASFIPRIQGADEDSIREDAQSLLDALSESGATPKQGPKPKAPKESKKKDPEALHSDGGDDGDEDSVDDILGQLKTMRGNAFLLNRS